jgi:two-component system CheB/CheR fusion protein
MEGYKMEAKKNTRVRNDDQHQRLDGFLNVPSDLGLRVLVVGEEPQIADTTLLLRLDGHVVDVAPDGPSALRTAQTQAPDVVVLDMSLLGKDGWQVARQLWARQTDRKPLLIAVGECVQEVEGHRSPEVELHLHLLKPVDANFLRKLLRRFQSIILPADRLQSRETRPCSVS